MRRGLFWLAAGVPLFSAGFISAAIAAPTVEDAHQFFGNVASGQISGIASYSGSGCTGTFFGHGAGGDFSRAVDFGRTSEAHINKYKESEVDILGSSKLHTADLDDNQYYPETEISLDFDSATTAQRALKALLVLITACKTPSPF